MGGYGAGELSSSSPLQVGGAGQVSMRSTRTLAPPPTVEGQVRPDQPQQQAPSAAPPSTLSPPLQLSNHNGAVHSTPDCAPPAPHTACGVVWDAETHASNSRNPHAPALLYAPSPHPHPHHSSARHAQHAQAAPPQVYSSGHSSYPTAPTHSFNPHPPPYQLEEAMREMQQLQRSVAAVELVVARLEAGSLCCVRACVRA